MEAVAAAGRFRGRLRGIGGASTRVRGNGYCNAPRAAPRWVDGAKDHLEHVRAVLHEAPATLSDSTHQDARQPWQFLELQPRGSLLDLVCRGMNGFYSVRGRGRHSCAKGIAISSVDVVTLVRRPAAITSIPVSMSHHRYRGPGSFEWVDPSLYCRSACHGCVALGPGRSKSDPCDGATVIRLAPPLPTVAVAPTALPGHRRRA